MRSFLPAAALAVVLAFLLGPSGRGGTRLPDGHGCAAGAGGTAWHPAGTAQHAAPGHDSGAVAWVRHGAPPGCPDCATPLCGSGGACAGSMAAVCTAGAASPDPTAPTTTWARSAATRAASLVLPPPTPPPLQAA